MIWHNVLWGDDDLAVPVDRSAGDDDVVSYMEVRPEVGDIVEVAVRGRCVVFAGASDRDASATLRVLATDDSGEYVRHLLLVTDGDAAVVSSTLTIDKYVMDDWEVEPRFLGCEALIASELCLRKLTKKQQGKFCAKCTDYSEEACVDVGREYLCSSCRLNPWR